MNALLLDVDEFSLHSRDMHVRVPELLLITSPEERSRLPSKCACPYLKGVDARLTVHCAFRECTPVSSLINRVCRWRGDPYNFCAHISGF